MAQTKKNTHKTQKIQTRKFSTPLIVGLALVAAVAIAGVTFMAGGGKSKAIVISPTPVATPSVQRSLEEFRGKVVILDFWATWCGPCRSEIPGLVALQNKYRDQGVEIIGVSLDPLPPVRGGGEAAVAPFMQKNGINYTIWTIDNLAALSGYDVTQGIPTKYIIDREGRVVNKRVGAPPNSAAVLENDIKPLL